MRSSSLVRSSLALVNLRAVVIVIVLAFHSVLAYLASLPATPYRVRRARPIAGRPSHRRQPSLVRLRPVLRLAGRQPDVADVLSVGPVRAVEPGRKGSRTFLVRPVLPDRLAAGPGGRVPDAGDVLPDLSRHRRRSERRRLLAATDWRCRSGRAGRNGSCGSCWRSTCWPPGCIASLRLGAKASAGWRQPARTIRSGFLSCWLRVGAGLRAAGSGLFALAWANYRTVLVPAQPAAALSRLFLRRLCGRRPWARPRLARQRWCAGAELGRVARPPRLRASCCGPCRRR